MDATLSTLESEASSINAQMTMSSIMVKTTKTLARLNRMVRLTMIMLVDKYFSSRYHYKIFKKLCKCLNRI